MKSIIRFLLFSFFLAFNIAAYSQCNLLPNAIPGMPLVHQNPNSYNNSGIAFNPNLNLYYGVRAGNPTFPLETWDASGVVVFDTLCGFDWRGMWWNPTTNQLEGNGFNTYGMWKADLNASGYALSTGTYLFTGMNQPDMQSVGDLDWQAYEVLYYFNDSIYRYSRTTNAFLGSYPITGTPVPTSNLNSTTLMYTGCPGKEIALLDYINLRVYVYDKATGAYAGTSQLPATAIATTSFRTSWANCYVWLFDLSTNTWFSYKIFDACATCLPVTSIQNPSICTGDSLFVGGGWQNNGGTYFDTLVTVNGCDSIIASVLNVLPAASSTQILSACSGDSVMVGGGWQTNSGTYYDTLSSASGCDSIVASTLSILTSVSSTQNLSVCSGDSLFVGGGWQINSGTYYDTLSSAGGCDSLITSTLSILPSASSAQSLSVCSGDSIFVGGGWQNISGTYYDTLSTAGGCDSIVASTLSILPSVSSIQNLSVCSGDSLFIGGSWQNSSGTFYDTLSAAGGCDSIVASTLSILLSVSSIQNLSVCSGDSLFIGGNWQYSSGTYYDTLTATGGCDSIISSTLSVSSSITSNQNLSICSGGSIFIGGALRNTPGIYNDTLVAVGGCDSIVRTTLVVNQVPVTSNALSICQGHSILLAGHLQSTPGIYRDTLITANGCDSIISTTLSVNFVPIVDLGDDTILCQGKNIILNANISNVQYLWQDNSANATYIVTQQGIYWLKASNNCGSNTDSLFVEEKNCDCSFYIPNTFTPNNDSKNDGFMPAFDCPFTEYQFMIFDRWGEKIFDTSSYADAWDGSYKGEMSQIGVYLYAVTYKFGSEDSITKYGKVSLIR